ncbi:MAG: CPBP family intramembrane metalloprotease [Microbacterium sp.]|jgi:membrane protease YdiL (CAAX protease family)|nr:CPBP family intramembrane metalloprotease [Microbacterium sp.]
MSATASAKDRRFGRLIERRGGADFPFYNLVPVEVATWKWLVIILSCIVGFLVLVLIPFESQLLLLIPRVFFTGIQLVVFALLVRPDWRAIFRAVKGADIGVILLFAVINLVVALIMGVIVKSIFGANADAATAGIADLSPLEMTAFFVGTAIQILGEELFTILPFLALLYWFHKAGMSRRPAVVLALFVSAIWFGLAHLPAYDWNIIQVLLVIAISRLILTLAYIRTKNIWVSFGVHLLHDWVGFIFLIVTGGAVGAALM